VRAESSFPTWTDRCPSELGLDRSSAARDQGNGGIGMTPSSHERDNPSGKSQKTLAALSQVAVICEAVSIFCLATNSNAALALGAKTASAVLRMIVHVSQR
jgi:hypothetical protein